MLCPICASAAIEQVNELAFYSSGGDRRSFIMWCRNCGLFWRRFEEPALALERHYEASSYTQLEAEERWRRARAPFFAQLLRLLEEFANRGQRRIWRVPAWLGESECEKRSTKCETNRNGGNSRPQTAPPQPFGAFGLGALGFVSDFGFRVSDFRSRNRWYGQDGARGQRWLLDFGCSYGHLMDMATKQGYRCAGVELVEGLRERLRGRYAMYKSLEEVGEKQFDAITCIDSLYYSPNPAQEMVGLAQRLTPEGTMVVRIANRAPLLRLMLRWRGTFTNEQLGDQLFVLNDKTMRLLARRAGLGVRKVVLREHKRIWASWWHLLGYGVLPWFCALSGLKWTPGLTYVLQKELVQ